MQGYGNKKETNQKNKASTLLELNALLNLHHFAPFVIFIYLKFFTASIKIFNLNSLSFTFDV